jgi:hypothetical protein
MSLVKGIGDRDLVRRLDRTLDAGHDTQPRRGQCVVCLADWETCPHSRAEVDGLLAARRQARLGRILAASKGAR